MSNRKLPVYLLIDTSGSMRGEPIQAVDVGLRAMLGALRQDPYALESAYISLITFDRDATLLLPLTALERVMLPNIEVPESGPTCLGAALQLLIARVDEEVVKTSASVKGDWRPLLFIMTDGSPTDLQDYRDMIPEIKRRDFSSVVVCAAGPKAKVDVLKELSDTIVSLQTMDSSSFTQFFKWVSASIAAGSGSAGISGEIRLPPPPPEVHVVI